MWFEGKYDSDKGRGSLSAKGTRGFIKYERSEDQPIVTVISNRGSRYPVYMNETTNGMVGTAMFPNYAVWVNVTDDDMIRVKIRAFARRKRSMNTSYKSRPSNYNRRSYPSRNNSW